MERSSHVVEHTGKPQPLKLNLGGSTAAWSTDFSCGTPMMAPAMMQSMMGMMPMMQQFCMFQSFMQQQQQQEASNPTSQGCMGGQQGPSTGQLKSAANWQSRLPPKLPALADGPQQNVDAGADDTEPNAAGGQAAAHTNTELSPLQQLRADAQSHGTRTRETTTAAPKATPCTTGYVLLKLRSWSEIDHPLYRKKCRNRWTKLRFCFSSL